MDDLGPILYAEPERKEKPPGGVKNVVKTLLLEAAVQARLEADEVVEKMAEAAPYVPVVVPGEAPPESEEESEEEVAAAPVPPAATARASGRKRTRASTGGGGGGGSNKRAKPGAKKAAAARVVQEPSDEEEDDDTQRQELLGFLEENYDPENEEMVAGLQAIVGTGSVEATDLSLDVLQSMKAMIERPAFCAYTEPTDTRKMPNMVWTPDELSQRLWGNSTAHADSLARKQSFGSASSTPSTKGFTPVQQPLGMNLERTNSKMAQAVRRASERNIAQREMRAEMKPKDFVLPKALY